MAGGLRAPGADLPRGLPRRDHARQRPGGRQHPLPHGTDLERAGADADGRVRRALAGRHRATCCSRASANVLRAAGLTLGVSSIVTEVEVAPDDPAFDQPDQAGRTVLQPRRTPQRIGAETGWEFVEDSGRGWRRVVPSPMPLQDPRCAGDQRASRRRRDPDRGGRRRDSGGARSGRRPSRRRGGDRQGFDERAPRRRRGRRCARDAHRRRSSRARFRHSRPSARSSG